MADMTQSHDDAAIVVERLRREIRWMLVVAAKIKSGEYRLVENLHTPQETYVANYDDIGRTLTGVLETLERLCGMTRAQAPS